MTGTATILRADARALPLPDASVDLIVTSPPYFALRSYQDTCNICLAIRADGRDPAVVIKGYEEHVRLHHHYGGQIGAEQTPAEYIDALIDCTREWVRVLKPSGSIWLNLGDKYNGSGGTSGHTGANGSGQRVERRSNGRAMAIPVKSLMLLPERYRIAAVDQLGLIARAVVIWSKPNGLPESCTDRVRRSHEDWVHLTREPRYYSAVDEIRTPGVGCHPRGKLARQNPHRRDGTPDISSGHPLGSLPGSVWEIATEPLTVPAELGIDHFAAFPTEWPRRIILGWSPSGICVECGEGRRPVVDRTHDTEGRTTNGPRSIDRRRLPDGTAGFPVRARLSVSLTGYACACPEPTAPTRPAVVLDPFGGTGTTALVAKVLGRHGISVDRSADYCRLASWRTTDPGQLAKAMRVPAPPKQLAGQDALDLFGGVA